MILAFLTGLLAGAIHVVTGPDHLAAIAPLAASEREKPWKTGARWGLGHSGGVLLVGLLLLFARSKLPVERLSAGAEIVVGVTLLGIGFWGFRRALSRQLHAHTHRHGSHQHVHIHLHGRSTAHAPAEGVRHHHQHAAWAVGTLHGLAGGSHFFAVLPALALPGVVPSVTYLVGYGASTILAMSAFAELIQHMTLGASRWGVRPYRIALGTLACISMGTGAYWILEAI